jgi:hypothetical protein
MKTSGFFQIFLCFFSKTQIIRIIEKFSELIFFFILFIKTSDIELELELLQYTLDKLISSIHAIIPKSRRKSVSFQSTFKH